jgi:hypothetical protein
MLSHYGKLFQRELLHSQSHPKITNERFSIDAAYEARRKPSELKALPVKVEHIKEFCCPVKSL